MKKALCTTVMLSLAAATQWSLTRVLALSTSSMLGWSVLGVGLGAYSTAAFLLLAHAFSKALLVLAAVITQFPFAEKIIAPYILILVTTPMLALVPLLILRFGFGYEPRIIAVALASGGDRRAIGAYGLLQTAAALLPFALALLLPALIWRNRRGLRHG